MIVEDLVRVYLWPPKGRFRRVVKPRFVFTDFLWQHAIQGWRENGGLAADYDIQAVVPMPIRIPHNNLLELGTHTPWDTEWDKVDDADGWDVTLPAVQWSLSGSHTMVSSVTPIWGSSTAKPVGIFAAPNSYLDADDGKIALEAELDCVAFEATLVARSQPRKSFAAGSAGGTSTTPDKPSQVSVAVRVGPELRDQWYRVSVVGAILSIQLKEEGSDTWKLLQMMPLPRNSFPVDEQHAAGPMDIRLSVEFRLLGGKMKIRIAGLGNDFIYNESRSSDPLDEDSDPLWTIDGAAVEAIKVVGLELFSAPIRWKSTGYADSPEQPIGKAWADAPTLDVRTVDPAPEGWTASIDDANSSLGGPDIYYRLQLTGPVDGTYQETDWAKYPVCVRQVLLTYPETVNYDPEAPMIVEGSAVVVSHTFDPGRLAVFGSAIVSFVANKPLTLPTGEFGSWADWCLNHGQWACEIYLARTLANGSMSPFELVFTGYANSLAEIEAQGGGAVFKMHCVDRMAQLVSPRWNLANRDGWNHFYSAYYLAQLGGVDIEDMDFAASIPTDPYGDSLDEDLEGAYFLPYGLGGSVITRDSGQMLQTMLQRQGVASGYLHAFGVNGKLQYRKFRLPTGIKRVFYDSDMESGGLEGLEHVSMRRDMASVRSELITIGVDAYDFDRTIVKQSEDAAVLDTPGFNHLGYEMPAVWIDNIFANDAFAEDANEKTFRTLRVPGLDLKLLCGWLQPDIFPLDVIEVRSAKTGTTGLPLMVLGARHFKSIEGPGKTVLDVRHYVPESW